jgi:hypothetical protein
MTWVNPLLYAFPPSIQKGLNLFSGRSSVNLTLQGYLNKHWGNAVCSSKDDPSPTPEECWQWSKLATNQIWSLVTQPWDERNKSFHKEKIAITHSKLNAKIIKGYAQRGKHASPTCFAPDIKMLTSRLNTEKRFLERVAYTSYQSYKFKKWVKDNYMIPCCTVIVSSMMQIYFQKSAH